MAYRRLSTAAASDRRTRCPRRVPFARLKGPQEARRLNLAASHNCAFITFAIGAISIASLFGCQTKGYQGQSRDQVATFSVRALRTELPADVAVPTVAAAGEAALRARGYSIDEKSVTHDHARLVAKGARDQGWLEQTAFESYVTPNGTGIMVRVEPWGDEAASRAILDDVLARLGR